ncbi:hypothetical protein ACJX0J_020961, partial [Zea mays]
EEPRVLRGEEGKPLDARRCSKRCTNRIHRRSCKRRLGLFMDREMPIEQLTWCQPQDAIGGRPQRRMDITSGCSPSKCPPANTT